MSAADTANGNEQPANARGWARCGTSIVALCAATVFAVACDNGNRNATTGVAAPDRPSISAGQAEARLRGVALTADDVGAGYAQDLARVQTNAQAARARPDTQTALRQFDAWGQVLSFNVQYRAPSIREIIYTPQFARVMQTATLFQDADGAATALLYVRALSPELLGDLLTNEGAGTQITDATVTKDIAFPAKGDESFAWRVGGKASFGDRLTINFIADTVFVRVGNLNAALTVVALGRAPGRDELVRIVDRVVEKAAR